LQFLFSPILGALSDLRPAAGGAAVEFRMGLDYVLMALAHR